MRIWLDAQLSPALAVWLQSELQIDAVSVRELGLRDADDAQIFDAARSADAIVMTKDSDFVGLLERLGPPPKVIWLRIGNSSNVRLKQVLRRLLPDILRMLESGESLVEIGDAW